MNAQINLLQAEIQDNLESIAAAYHKLHEISQGELDEDVCILAAYHFGIVISD